MYRILFLQDGSSALYFRISFPERADATMALTLNVFLLLGLPVEALKFPIVAMVTPSICTISCGNSYFSVTLSLIYFSKDCILLRQSGNCWVASYLLALFSASSCCFVLILLIQGISNDICLPFNLAIGEGRVAFYPLIQVVSENEDIFPIRFIYGKLF